MRLFEAVHEGVTAHEAAEYCGIKISHNNMACCPFHDDRTPSMKIDDHYYCFGCGVHGDSIDFYSLYNKCSKKDAALQLADIFHIIYDDNDNWSSHRVRRVPTNPQKPKSAKQQRKEAVNEFWRDITGYYHDLQNRLEIYAPKKSEAGDIIWDDRYISAINQIPYIEYLMDSFLSGKDDEQNEIMALYKRLSTSTIEEIA